MRIRELQDNLRKLLSVMDVMDTEDFLGNLDPELNLVLSAKIMAIDLLRENNPKEVLLEAFIQLFLVASIINLDLEREIEKIVNKYTGLSAQGG